MMTYLWAGILSLVLLLLCLMYRKRQHRPKVHLTDGSGNCFTYVYDTRIVGLEQRVKTTAWFIEDFCKDNPELIQAFQCKLQSFHYLLRSDDSKVPKEWFSRVMEGSEGTFSWSVTALGEFTWGFHDTTTTTYDSVGDWVSDTKYSPMDWVHFTLSKEGVVKVDVDRYRLFKQLNNHPNYTLANVEGLVTALYEHAIFMFQEFGAPATSNLISDYAGKYSLERLLFLTNQTKSRTYILDVDYVAKQIAVHNYTAEDLDRLNYRGWFDIDTMDMTDGYRYDFEVGHLFNDYGNNQYILVNTIAEQSETLPTLTTLIGFYPTMIAYDHLNTMLTMRNDYARTCSA